MYYHASPKALELFSKLQRLAGGDLDVVYAALSQHQGSPVRLTEVIRYIEVHRKPVTRPVTVNF